MTEQSLDALISCVAHAEQEVAKAREATLSAELRESDTLRSRDEARDNLKLEIERRKKVELAESDARAVAA